MRFLSRIPRRVWVRLGIAAALGLVVAGAVAQHVMNSIMEFYSPGFISSSSADAERSGVLVKRPMVLDSVVPVRTGEIRVRDLWVEDVTRIEHRFLFWRRVVRTERQRMVIHATLPYFASREGTNLAVVGSASPGDTIAMSGRTGAPPVDIFMHMQAEPFPDTVRVIAVPRTW